MKTNNWGQRNISGLASVFNGIWLKNDGTLTKWNDDPGFGFIKRTRGGQEMFAHISAFPRDRYRPKTGEGWKKLPLYQGGTYSIDNM